MVEFTAAADVEIARALLDREPSQESNVRPGQAKTAIKPYNLRGRNHEATAL
jgi:hypothetical protein